MQSQMKNSTILSTMLALIVGAISISAQSVYTKTIGISAAKTTSPATVKPADGVKISDAGKVTPGIGATASPASDHIYGYIRWKKAYGVPAVQQPLSVDLKNGRLIKVRSNNPCARFSVVATVRGTIPGGFAPDVKVGETTATSFKETADGYECFYNIAGLPGGTDIRVNALLNNPLWLPGSDPLSGNPAYDKSLQVIGGSNFVVLRRTRPDFPASAQLSFQMALTPKQIVR